MESQGSRSRGRKTREVFSPQEAARPSSEDTFPASALLDKHTCLRRYMRILNFSALSRTSRLSGKFLELYPFQLGKFLLQCGLEALTVSGGTVNAGTWEGCQRAFKTPVHRGPSTAWKNQRWCVPQGRCRCLKPGFLFFWKRLCSDTCFCEGCRLKFPRQYPDFECTCLSKMYVHWLSNTIVARCLIRKVDTLIEAVAFMFAWFFLNWFLPDSNTPGEIIPLPPLIFMWPYTS